MRNKFQPKKTSDMIQVGLPSKVDRLLMYRRIEGVVASRIQEIHSLPDTRPRPVNVSAVLLFSKVDELPHPSTVGVRRRLIEYFRFEFLPTVSAALLLELEDLHQDEELQKQLLQEKKKKKQEDDDEEATDNQDDEEPPTPPKPSLQEPIECIALLISNMLLVSKGNYDARVRSILKTVCTQVLLEQQQQQSSSTSQPLSQQEVSQEETSQQEADDAASATSSDAGESTTSNPRASTTSSVASSPDSVGTTTTTSSTATSTATASPIPTKQQQTSRSLYFLKFSDVDENNPVVVVNNDTDEVTTRNAQEDDVRQTSTLPTLTPAQEASRQLESIERAIATDILKAALEKASRQEAAAAAKKEEDKTRRNQKRNQRVKQVLVRGLQITTVGVVVGAAFAFTGGLAAPGLVAAISALGIGTSSVAFATLTTVQALASMFGVVGGGLAAYKMKKRTQGLSEWRIRKETLTTSVGKQQDAVTIRGLHASVCVSGWLVDKSDFQRPWGIQPDDPEIKEKMELLQRFFAVHGPEKVHFCKALLKANKKNTQDLWIGLARRYGRDPDNLLPFDRTAEPQDLSPEWERKVNGLLKYQVLREEHASRMEQIYETNNMLIKMEAMNTDLMGETRPVLDALRTDEEVLVKMKVMNTEVTMEAMNADLLKSSSSSSIVSPQSLETTSDEAATQEAMANDAGETTITTEQESTEAKEETGEPKEDTAEVIGNGDKDEERTETGELKEDAAEPTDNGDVEEAPLPTQVGATDDDEQKEDAAAIEKQVTENGDANLAEDDNTPQDVVDSACPTPIIDNARKTSDASTDDETEQATEVDQEDAKVKTDEEGALESSAVDSSNTIFDENAILAKMEAANEEVMLDLSSSRSDAESSMNDSTEDIVMRDRINEAVLSVDTGSAQEMKQVNNDLMGPLAWFRMSPLESKKQTVAAAANETTTPNGTSDPEKPAAVKNCVSGETAETLEDDDERSQESSNGAGGGGNLGKTDHDLVVWDWQASYGGELYTVTWETSTLLKLCKVVNVLALELTDQVTKQVIQNAVLAGTVAIPSAMVTCLAVVDDPYQLISFRSEKAGIELAHCLMQSDEHRPISMVGFSFGARVVFSCLLELARHQALWEEKQKQPETDEADKSTRWSFTSLNSKPKIDPLDDIDYTREPASIIEDVVIIGMPRLLDVKEWVTCREIVSGRLVNCYKKDDWIVSYMINVRCWNGVRSTCGTHPVDARVPGVENFEVSDLVSTHGRYQLSVPQIMHRVAYGTARKWKSMDHQNAQQ
eukprot:CAMPEP_0194036988 /NCGR_PEP_ID=MMETSP0009_2-20130614/9364_1 /TAXON_ID=210454 /ORGANISM="Grammatophora oceanica, Strain CCMP 410" /LENGTH=1275 /DNA_ID=CAMNT_0038678975 /DNA_START=211 /DNA_END=4041 /DNA_ORIENTATION=+